MRTNKAAPWVAGAVVAIFVILAAGWFLAISPALAAADDSRAQTAVERDHNARLNKQIATLKDQFTHLEEYKTQLAALRVQLPPREDLSALNTEVQSLVASAGLTTTAFGATTAQAFVPVATAAAPAPAAAANPVATPAPTAGTGAAVADAGSAKAAPSLAGFYAVPLSITVVGTYDATLTFLDSLQTKTSRLYLVGSVTASSQRNEGAANGKPATSAGDLETTIAAFAYVLQDASAAVAAPPATPSPLPVPSTQKNPFVPVH